MKKSIWVTPNEQAGHATTLPCQIDLTGCYIQTHQTAFHRWNPKLYLRASTSVSSPDTRVFRELWYHWEVSLSANRNGPITSSINNGTEVHLIPMFLARGLYCTQMWMMCTLNTHSLTHSLTHFISPQDFVQDKLIHSMCDVIIVC
jgi:hypothetical protein